MITGAILIAGEERDGERHFRGVDPATGRDLDPPFASAGAADVEAACAAAEAAFPAFAAMSPADRAAFLEAVGDAIAKLGDALIEQAMAETGLPRARLEGERARTIAQCRLFASVLREGAWIGATIDAAQPDRRPLPRADLRRVNLPLGPVAVFGASNFPLAYSVAGGDTTSAFAAGCPVVVKGHPAHPGTGELVARAVGQAVAACGLPAGIFSYLPGETNELGAALVADRRIRAVGFTGSRSGGLALAAIAAARPEPIPVFAEMSSINPVVLLPAALAARGAALAPAFVQSLTMGAGQFCTNPGLVLAIEGDALDAFVAAAGEALAAVAPVQMLTANIHRSFENDVAALAGHAAVETVARGLVGEGVAQAQGALFRTDAESFLADPTLAHEVFGSSSIVVACRDEAALARVIAALEGQLTATIHLDDEDHAMAARLLPLLARKAGRVIADGWPTGVEVTHAMVHGGPYPATADGRTSSVGSLAIDRFVRPVCYQNMPDALLPPALREGNPWGVKRRED